MVCRAEAAGWLRTWGDRDLRAGLIRKGGQFCFRARVRSAYKSAYKTLITLGD
jgi:hypothetical protein